MACSFPLKIRSNRPVSKGTASCGHAPISYPTLDRPGTLPHSHSHESLEHTGFHPMGFKCGIVGLPNVGKSTLFNALTKTAAAQAANYPFCTIEPNTGEVAVPDPRMQKLASI